MRICALCCDKTGFLLILQVFRFLLSRVYQAICFKCVTLPCHIKIHSNLQIITCFFFYKHIRDDKHCSTHCDVTSVLRFFLDNV